MEGIAALPAHWAVSASADQRLPCLVTDSHCLRPFVHRSYGTTALQPVCAPSRSACNACACAGAGRAPGPVVRSWGTAALPRCAVRCQASGALRTVAERIAGNVCVATLATSRRCLQRTEGCAARRTPRRSAFAGVDARQYCRSSVQGGLVQSFRRDAGAAGGGRRHQPRLGGPARGTCRQHF